MVHLIAHGVSEYGDEYGGKILFGAKLGGFDVGIGEVGDEDGGDLVVAQVDVVLKGELGLMGGHLVLKLYVLAGRTGGVGCG